MVQGKPHLIIGEGKIAPTLERKQRAQGQGAGSSFASFLSAETTAPAMGSLGSSPLDAKKTSPAKVQNDGVLTSSASSLPTLIGAKTSNPMGPRLSFGMEDTRPLTLRAGRNKKNSPTSQARRGAHTPLVLGSPSGLAENAPLATTLSKVLETSPTRLSTITSLPVAQQSAPYAIQGLQPGGTSQRNPSHSQNSAMSFDYALTSGNDTQALLKAFNTLQTTFAIGEANTGQLPVLQAEKPHTPAATAPRKSFLETVGYSGELGSLAAKFESGEQGIAAIGYDRTGGTSYGKYQISSRAGTMNSFIDYLKEKAPELATRLASSGSANTGGSKGKMPTEWRAIAAENPTRFESLQSDFIKGSHYEPTLAAVMATTGLSQEMLPSAIQEVIFSTAVQHGPAGAIRIINRAVSRTGSDKFQASALSSIEAMQKTGQEFIRHIYDIRSRQFGSSSNSIQTAVKGRLRQEMSDALALLRSSPNA